VDPTPVIGMVGLLEDLRLAVRPWLARTGDRVLLLGAMRGHLGGSAYWAEVLGFVGGAPPPVDLAAERRLVDLLVAMAGRGLLASAHDLSEGGLSVATAEACLGAPYGERPLGAQLDLRALQGSLSECELLFGEDHGRALVSCAAERVEGVLALAREHGVPAAPLGTVGAPGATLRMTLRDRTLEWPVGELQAIYTAAIPRRMGTFQVQQAAD
jgi:phosphoribosylformylglycinamidine synthase